MAVDSLADLYLVSTQFFKYVSQTVADLIFQGSLPPDINLRSFTGATGPVLLYYSSLLSLARERNNGAKRLTVNGDLKIKKVSIPCVKKT